MYVFYAADADARYAFIAYAIAATMLRLLMPRRLMPPRRFADIYALPSPPPCMPLFICYATLRPCFRFFRCAYMAPRQRFTPPRLLRYDITLILCCLLPLTITPRHEMFVTMLICHARHYMLP